MGIRVSVGFNIVDQTLCINPGVFIEPWEIRFQWEQQIIQCKTDIIGYPGNLKPTSLFGISETWLGECALSPYVTFTAWRFPLFQTDEPDSAHYMFNQDYTAYDIETCRPGRVWVLDKFTSYSPIFLIDFYDAFLSINNEFN